MSGLIFSSTRKAVTAGKVSVGDVRSAYSFACSIRHDLGDASDKIMYCNFYRNVKIDQHNQALVIIPTEMITRVATDWLMRGLGVILLVHSSICPFFIKR